MQVSRGCFGFCQYNWLVGLRMKVVCGVGRLSGARLGSRGSSWQTGSSSADTRSLPARDSLAAPGPRTCQHGRAAWQGRTQHTHSQISIWSQGSFSKIKLSRHIKYVAIKEVSASWCIAQPLGLPELFSLQIGKTSNWIPKDFLLQTFPTLWRCWR